MRSPEEPLDTESVYGHVVRNLHESKERRQFLFTTHNANIAVSADADLSHVLDATAKKGWVRSSVHWSIKKHHDKKDYLLYGMGEGTGGWEGEIREEFPRLLRSAVVPKMAKLAGEELPVVLLLVDDYHYASRQLWHTALPRDYREAFHTVARTFQEYECQILSSADETWESAHASTSSWRQVAIE